MVNAVAISGASGSVGSKLITYLAEFSPFTRLVGMDLLPPAPDTRKQVEEAASRNSLTTPSLEWITCDFTDPRDRRWLDPLHQVDGFVHLAFRNALSTCSWADVGASIDMVNYTALEAVRSKTLTRYLFASSNHVMGGYKEPFETGRIQPGGLTTQWPPRVGTIMQRGQRILDFTAYASAKFAGERLLSALAAQSDQATTFCAIRIGWSVRDSSFPAHYKEMFDDAPDASEPEREKQALSRLWTHSMWISTRDLGQLFTKALQADASTWPHGYCVVHGMSNNRGMPWSLEEGRQWMGYEPEDDFFKEAEKLQS
jgi:nucleoside-diphosphate-sugar epimerase